VGLYETLTLLGWWTLLSCGSPRHQSSKRVLIEMTLPSSGVAAAA
jgi:hypothetical protein